MSSFSSDEVIIDINLEKITQGVKNWERVPYAVETGVRNGIEELADRIKQKLEEEATMMGLGGSQVVNQIVVFDVGDAIVITNNVDHALFVEFGTGVRGEQSPHPRPWNYDVNGHGEQGWWYPTDNSDPNPIKRYGAGGSVWAWTAGMPSRPFMYEAWLWGSRSATQIIRKHIRAEIKKISGVR